MRTENRRWISSMLLILFLLSGVCFGESNADFFLMYQTTQQEIPNKQTLDLKTCNSISCTAEILETRGMIQLINDTAKRTGFKINRCLLFLLLVATVLHIFSNFSMAVNRARIPLLRQRAVVLHYIHNADGKK